MLSGDVSRSRAFIPRLHQLHIPVRTDFYGPSGHDWPYLQRDLRRSLP